MDREGVPKKITGHYLSYSYINKNYFKSRFCEQKINSVTLYLFFIFSLFKIYDLYPRGTIKWNTGKTCEVGHNFGYVTSFEDLDLRF